MGLPVGSVGVPYHLPRVVDPVSRSYTSPPSVPRSVMPTPLGPVMKAWLPVGSRRSPLPPAPRR